RTDAGQYKLITPSTVVAMSVLHRASDRHRGLPSRRMRAGGAGTRVEGIARVRGEGTLANSPPSADSATARTPPACPLPAASRRLLSEFHSRTAPSRPPLAVRLPSAESSTLRTPPACPRQW